MRIHLPLSERSNLFRRIRLLIAPLVVAVSAWSQSNAEPIFDMEAILDPETLEIEIVQDWHLVKGPVPTRQKLITINVGKIWEDQEYRLPVRMVVPDGEKASGFHLTGGSSPKKT